MADLNTSLPGVAGATAAAVGLALILRTVRQTAAEVGGSRVLAYGRPLKIFVAAAWACWVGFLVAALLTPPEDRPIAATFVGGYLLAVVVLHLEIFRVRVAFYGDGIRTRSPWHRGRQFPWAAVERAWYSQAMSWYIVQTRGFGRVRLHDFLSGTESLLAELEARGVPVTRRVRR